MKLRSRLRVFGRRTGQGQSARLGQLVAGDLRGLPRPHPPDPVDGPVLLLRRRIAKIHRVRHEGSSSSSDQSDSLLLHATGSQGRRTRNFHSILDIFFIEKLVLSFKGIQDAPVNSGHLHLGGDRFECGFHRNHSHQAVEDRLPSVTYGAHRWQKLKNVTVQQRYAISMPVYFLF